MKAKYDVELLKLMSLFEKITRADLKDCFVNRERVVFIVQHGEMGKALGKQKFNLQKIEEAINRKIKIVEFNPDVLEFIKNLMYPLKILEIKQDDSVVIIKGSDTKTKGLMIGARAQNLRNYEELVKKYFDNVNEIKVV